MYVIVSKLWLCLLAKKKNLVTNESSADSPKKKSDEEQNRTAIPAYVGLAY